MSQHVYDYAIIGAGLSGLSVATRLSLETRNVILLDGAEHAGGMNRPISFPTGPLNNGLRFVPEGDLAKSALHFLEDQLDLKIIKGASSVPSVTYEEGQLKSFVGFGDMSPDFYEEILPFTSTHRLDCHLEPYEWVALLLEKFQGQFQPRSYVTRFHLENGAVTHLTINGAKTIKAANYVYAGPVKSLATLLPPEGLPARVRHKLSKNTYWTALCLDLCHAKPVTESAAMHILNGTTQDDIGPCAGIFHPALDVEGKMLQTSQWITFVDEEASEDSEIVGQALKKIKKQIKRAFPEALEGLVKERIMVAPMIGGHGDLKVTASQTLPDIANLWMASSALSPAKNLVGALLQAKLALAAMGFAKEEFSASPSVAAQLTGL